MSSWSLSTFACVPISQTVDITTEYQERFGNLNRKKGRHICTSLVQVNRLFALTAALGPSKKHQTAIGAKITFLLFFGKPLVTQLPPGGDGPHDYTFTHFDREILNHLARPFIALVAAVNPLFVDAVPIRTGLAKDGSYVRTAPFTNQIVGGNAI